MYTKLDPQPTTLEPGETAVTLDSGDIVATSISVEALETAGDVFITASARAINADGTARLLPSGRPITATFGHTAKPQETTDAGGLTAVQRCCLMAVLGEDTAPLWTDPIHSALRTSSSVRVALTAAADVQAAPSAAELL
jgi:hypothetical protein